jgi:hypothetical protein
VRTGDDQHGDDALMVKSRWRRREPDDERQGARDDRDEREEERRPVGQRLGPRARRLRLLDEPHDAGERGALAGARHLDAERALAVDRAGDDLVALAPSSPGCDSPVIIASLTSLGRS